jgi:hypothetical protein
MLEHYQVTSLAPIRINPCSSIFLPWLVVSWGGGLLGQQSDDGGN